MTPKAFEEGIAILSSTYPNLVLTPQTLQVWRRLLEDLEDEAFKGAILRLCRELAQIFPGTNPVALIRERAAGGCSGIVALAVIEEAMRRHGAYKSVIFADPLIHLVVERMGGWPKLCEIAGDEWRFVRRDLERLYDVVAKELIPMEKIPAILPGLHEIGNAANGHIEAPTYLVDMRQTKALPGAERLEDEGQDDETQRVDAFGGHRNFLKNYGRAF